MAGYFGFFCDAQVCGQDAQGIGAGQRFFFFDALNGPEAEAGPVGKLLLGVSFLASRGSDGVSQLFFCVLIHSALHCATCVILTSYAFDVRRRMFKGNSFGLFF